ncbi:hypothetical protein [Actinoplanes regularis]|uniref:hypothetical protein n=1 Tax=Actinoplanes regularis TaxID=52697 RepID=UPI0025576D74|nr:hypothetical protein [Actinoplanes regularis]
MELIEAELLKYRDLWSSGAAVSEVEEHELGWVVHWAPVELLRGDLSYQLGGGGPYLVDRYDGSVHGLGTVAYHTGAWVWEYLEQVKGVVPLDPLTESVRQLLIDDGTMAAMRHLRSRAPRLTPAQAKQYVTSVRDGLEPTPDLIELTRWARGDVPCSPSWRISSS